MICQEFELPFSLFPKRGVMFEDPIRTEGLHLTDIIKSLMDEAGMMKTVSGKGWDPDPLNLAAETGFMWEELLSMTLKARLPDRIGEIVVDGITMSPDGFDVEEWMLWEYKAVWSSCKRSPVDNYKWICQVQGYLKGVGATTVKMAILYLNGDWKGGGPQYRGYKITFTQREIDETWQMITGHARKKGWIQ